MTRHTYRYAYLHGFASGPRSYKGTQLAETLKPYGVRLERPDLNLPSFQRLTYSGALRVLDALDSRTTDPAHTTWRFIGSSMGGYLAVRWAALNPDRVDRLILLCPGFDLATRWIDLIGPPGMRQWARNGAYPFDDPDGGSTPVHWGFMEDAQTHPPFPTVPCPTRIIHGTRDEVVPLDTSRDYAAEHAERVSLLEVPSDHGLADQLDTITHEAVTFFDLAPKED